MEESITTHSSSESSKNHSDSPIDSSGATGGSLAFDKRPSTSTLQPRVKRAKSQFDVDKHYDLVEEVVNGVKKVFSVCHYTAANGQPCSKRYSRSSKQIHKEKHYNDDHLGQSPYSEVDELILRAIVEENLPLAIADCPITHRMIRRVTNSKKILSLAEEKAMAQRQNMKLRIGQAQSVCLTTDLFFATRHECFACYIAHYIIEGKLHNDLIAFRAMPHPHEEINFNRMTGDILREYNCEAKLLAIIRNGTPIARSLKNTPNAAADRFETELTEVANFLMPGCKSLCSKSLKLGRIKIIIEDLAERFDLESPIELEPDDYMTTEAERAFLGTDSLTDQSDCINRELEFYLNSPAVSENKTTVELWEDRKQQLPILYRIAMIVFAAQATSVALDQVLSISKHLFTDEKTRLEDNHLEDLMILHFAHKSE